MKFKPYQLVEVEQDDYSYIGQVMSFATPDETIMVRRVPGHPGTLQELKLDIISSPPWLTTGQKQYRFVHYASVSGRGQFPVDMLRYDNAAPLNFTFTGEDRHGSPLPVIDPSFNLEGFWIAQVSKTRYPKWTPARWSSFLWGIRPEQTLEIGNE